MGDRTAARAVLDGGADAQRIFRKISNAKANDVLQQVRSTGADLRNSNPIDEFMKQNENAVNNKPGEQGGVVDSFAKKHGMTELEQARSSIEQSGNKLASSHTQKTGDASSQYQNARQENLTKQQSRKANIEKLEEDRIGNGSVGTAWGLLDGVGRSPDNSSAKNMEGDTKLPSKVIRPTTEMTSKDLADTKKLMEEFKPNSSRSGTRDSGLVEGDGQYADPSKKTKS